MIGLVTWLTDILGVSLSPENEFFYLLIAGVLVVIAFTCALSLFIGIAFAIFKR